LAASAANVVVAYPRVITSARPIIKDNADRFFKRIINLLLIFSLGLKKGVGPPL
jgi:hypothetical protein